MTDKNTTIDRSAGGWTATTTTRWETAGEHYQLRVETRKGVDGDLTTTALVSLLEGAFAKHRLHVDFYDRLEAVKARCTEGTVRAQHERHVRGEAWDKLVETAREWYEPKA